MTDTKKTVRSLSNTEGQENYEIDSELFNLCLLLLFHVFSSIFISLYTVVSVMSLLPLFLHVCV